MRQVLPVQPPEGGTAGEGGQIDYIYEPSAAVVLAQLLPRYIEMQIYEAILEVTYQHEVKPGFLLQPVFQYIAHPGGGQVDPNDPLQTHRIKDGVMVGVRTTITY